MGILGKLSKCHSVASPLSSFILRTYAEQTTVIAKLQQRVKALEEKPEAGNNTVN